MKKEGLVIGVLAIIVLGLIIFIMMRPEKEVEVLVDPGGGPVEEIEPEIPTLSLEEIADTVKDEYKDDIQFRQCLAETVEGCLSNVITMKIQETKDIALCDDYITEPQKVSCKVSQTTAQAREKKDPGLCSTLEENYKISCESEVTVIVAIENQDPNMCEKLGDNYKQNCRQTVLMTLAQETFEDKWCNELDEANKEMCLEELQMYTQEEQLQQEQEELQQQQELELQEQEEASVDDDVLEVDSDVSEEEDVSTDQEDAL